MSDFDPGYGEEPWRTLCSDYPDASVYPVNDFRVEWGPIFHRGRLDGSACLLVLGQDPATHETVARRILIGEAGQRIQGFLAKLGLSSSYVMVNTFLYSVYGQQGGEKHKNDQAIAAYRHKWLDALLLGTKVQAVVSLGTLADSAWQAWSTLHPQAKEKLVYQHVTHPTQPISAAKGNLKKEAELTALMLQNWNQALAVFHPAVTPDTPSALVPYENAFRAGDLVEIPAADLPAGLPDWMRSRGDWATRTGSSAVEKRATITITVPSKST
jgi:uracil-DNA glycosylase